MKFEESKTFTNLARAFAGECQAGARYQFIAQKAMQKDFSYLQTIMKTLAKQEMSHARVFWDLITKNSTEEVNNIEITAGYPFKNGELIDMIRYASNNEKSENTSIYPSFAKIAEDEGFGEIAEKFKLVALVENDHFMILDEIYTKMKGQKMYTSPLDIEWKCNSCGHSHFGKTAWKVCPLCEKGEGYIQIPLTESK